MRLLVPYEIEFVIEEEMIRTDVYNLELFWHISSVCLKKGSVDTRLV